MSNAEGGPRTLGWSIALLLLPVLAFFGASRGSHSSSAQRAESPPAATSDARPHTMSRCAERLLSPFRRLASAREAPHILPEEAASARDAPRKGEPSESTRVVEEQLGAVLRALPPEAKREALIATLPDPVESGQGYTFDTLLAALIAGIEAVDDRSGAPQDGYLRDRDWLPWDDRELSSEGRKASEACRRELPGVILFRSADPKRPAIFALLLVGESPITGVHPVAMREALRLADTIAWQPDAAVTHISTAPSAAAPAVYAEPRVLRVLGPSYSGSAQSLRHALDDFQRDEETARFEVVSGSATGSQVHEILRGPGIRYRATTVLEAALECSFLHYAQRTGARRASGQATAGTTVLDGVAMLRESGTGFGARLRSRSDASDAPCALAAEMQLTFPYHIGTIRDAYESLDGSVFATKEQDTVVSRHTSLELSLRGAARLDVESQLSRVTRSAQDLALSNLLRTISHEGVRWLGIQATDIGDALFLARKVRDVAPDVRLAFFQADALLLHPSLHNDLLGSIVVTPYPFFGTNTFRRGAHAMSMHGAFENSSAEGVFNAMLALRELPERAFSGYRFTERRENASLPIWIAALGRGQLSPVQARPAPDCARIVIGEDDPPDELCTSGYGDAARARAWKRFNRLRGLELLVDRDTTPPRLWYFVFALLALSAILDTYYQARVARELPPENFWSDPHPGDASAENDSPLDRGVIRTKWWLYATCARLTLAFGITYMGIVYIAATLTYTGDLDWLRVPLVLLVALAMVAWQWLRVARGAGQVARNVRGFRGLLRRLRWMGTAGTPSRALIAANRTGPRSGWRDAWCALQLYLGFHDGNEPGGLFYVSYAQLRLVASAAVLVALLFSWGTLDHLESGTDALFADFEPVPALTLFVLRSLPLVNGISPAFPLLVCLCCVYVWALGRMARLRLAHAISRAAPADDHLDAASTPMRTILYPLHARSRPADAGFTRAERRLSNAIVRPNGAFYFGTLLLLLALPAVLFLLKLPTTLEGAWTTALLFGSLSVCAVLISGTVVQLVQYWRALDEVLARAMAHPLSRAYQRVVPEVQRPVDAQISGPKCERLRICAAAAAVADAMDATASPATHKPGEAIRRMRREALGESSGEPEPMLSIDALLCTLVQAARSLMLWHASSSAVDGRRDQVECAAASVVGLLIQRHVLQFRNFLYASTASALLLLLAISGYAFEPRRVLMTCIWSLTLAVVIVGLGVFVQLSRSPMLNHLAGHPDGAGRLDWNREFVARVVVFALIPLVSLLAAQYPEFAAEIGMVIEPFSRTLR